jgi:hypothetical protein
VPYNEEREQKIEILEIMPKVLLNNFGVEQDQSETETSAGYDNYPSHSIDEY